MPTAISFLCIVPTEESSGPKNASNGVVDPSTVTFLLPKRIAKGYSYNTGSDYYVYGSVSIFKTSLLSPLEVVVLFNSTGKLILKLSNILSFYVLSSESIDLSLILIMGAIILLVCLNYGEIPLLGLSLSILAVFTVSLDVPFLNGNGCLYTLFMCGLGNV